MKYHLHILASPGFYTLQIQGTTYWIFHNIILAINIVLQLDYFYLAYCCFNNSVLSSLRLENMTIDSCHYFASLKKKTVLVNLLLITSLFYLVCEVKLQYTEIISFPLLSILHLLFVFIFKSYYSNFSFQNLTFERFFLLSRNPLPKMVCFWKVILNFCLRTRMESSQMCHSGC